MLNLAERVCSGMQQRQACAPEKHHKMAGHDKPGMQTALAGYLTGCIVQFVPELNDIHCFLLPFMTNFFFKLMDFLQNSFPVCSLFFRLA